MEFGIFSQMHVPPDDTEHARFLRELEVSLAVDAAGFKYNWAPEHHFLKTYSHQPAPEIYLSWVAARTRRIHVGFAIVNLTAAVNHPVRVAERIATMDHLSEGRVEVGTGRGSSTAEWAGFAIPSAAETKPMWRESLEQLPRMWRDEPYEFTGRYFRTPRRGVLCFTFGTPAEIAEHVRNYKEAIKRCERPVGAYINDNIAVTTNMFCLPDGDQARWLYSRARVEQFTEVFFHWLDSIPRPPGLPKEGPVRVPPPTVEELEAGLKVGGRQVGAPEEIAEVIRMYEAIGVDQLI